MSEAVRLQTAPMVAVLLAAGVLAVTGCGGGSAAGTTSTATASTSSSTGVTSGAIRMIMTVDEEPLDTASGVDSTMQGAGVNWLVYTGLTTYAHAEGAAGKRLIPGLAAALPVISDRGRTYRFTLRKRLVFSSGQPVRASDFTRAVERQLKLSWPGSREYVTPHIVGARAYARGRARTIAGISTDNSKRRIVIHLTAPDRQFENVLALPALGLVPAGTPMRVQTTTPPAGVGPYEITNVVPGRSFSVVENPHWSSMHVPGIPAAQANVNVELGGSAKEDTLSVLHDAEDVFESSDPLPAPLAREIEAQPRGSVMFVDGHGSLAYLISSRIDYRSLVYQPEYGLVLSSLALS